MREYFLTFIVYVWLLMSEYVCTLWGMETCIYIRVAVISWEGRLTFKE